MAAKSFLATGAATAAAAVAGTVATDVDSPWYRSLELPGWQPPGPVIGQIWTVLYALTAGATGRAWTVADPARRRRLAAALGVNLALNAAWPWVFFRGHRPVLGVAVIGALEAFDGRADQGSGPGGPEGGRRTAALPGLERLRSGAERQDRRPQPGRPRSLRRENEPAGPRSLRRRRGRRTRGGWAAERARRAAGPSAG